MKYLLASLVIGVLAPSALFAQTPAPAATNQPTQNQATTPGSPSESGNYIPLAPLPGTTCRDAARPEFADGCTNPNETTLQVYLGGIYLLAIGISFALVFVMIMWGGIQYLSTDAISGKSEGREKIQNALWGLIIVLTAYLLLYTIDKRLLDFSLFGGGSAGGSSQTSGTSGTAVPTGGGPTRSDGFQGPIPDPLNSGDFTSDSGFSNFDELEPIEEID
jgi:hypothetical protein